MEVGASDIHSEDAGVRVVVNALVHGVCVEHVKRVVILYGIVARPWGEKCFIRAASSINHGKKI